MRLAGLPALAVLIASSCADDLPAASRPEAGADAGLDMRDMRDPGDTRATSDGPVIDVPMDVPIDLPAQTQDAGSNDVGILQGDPCGPVGGGVYSLGPYVNFPPNFYDHAAGLNNRFVFRGRVIPAPPPVVPPEQDAGPDAADAGDGGGGGTPMDPSPPLPPHFYIDRVAGSKVSVDGPSMVFSDQPAPPLGYDGFFGTVPGVATSSNMEAWRMPAANHPTLDDDIVRVRAHNLRIRHREYITGLAAIARRGTLKDIHPTTADPHSPFVGTLLIDELLCGRAASELEVLIPYECTHACDSHRPTVFPGTRGFYLEHARLPKPDAGSWAGTPDLIVGGREHPVESPEDDAALLKTPPTLDL
jgi:hypothetical protein